jgi:acyl transferase domain-containing protein
MAGTLPTCAEGMLSADAVQPVPLERWDVEMLQRASGSGPEARFGAFIASADLFDSAAFNISRCAA